MATKGVIIILDGLGDRPSALLDGKTPLEAAATPHLNRLAIRGEWGQVDPAPEGHGAHTHSGVGVLFGLSGEDAPKLARGPIELAGIDGRMKRGDVALRANFAHIERQGEEIMVLDRRAGRIDEGTDELAMAIDGLDLGEGVRAEFRTTEQHRGVLLLTGSGLSAAVTSTDPGNVKLPAALPASQATDPHPAARKTARLINRLSEEVHQRLEDHPLNVDRRARGLAPANGLITRGAGTRIVLDNSHLEPRLDTAVVAGCSTVKGLARIFGFQLMTRPQFSGDRHTDLHGKVDAVLDALASHQMVYLHVKATDVFAHDRDAVGKCRYIEQIDQAFAPLLGQDLVIGVCSDHGTDSNTGWHFDDPVPSMVSGLAPNFNNNEINFSEKACAQGPMGTLDGREFLLRVREGMGLDDLS